MILNILLGTRFKALCSYENCRFLIQDGLSKTVGLRERSRSVSCLRLNKQHVYLQSLAKNALNLPAVELVGEDKNRQDQAGELCR